jgi:hypothetical protein
VTGEEGGPGVGDPGGRLLGGEGGGEPGEGRCDDPRGPAGRPGSTAGVPGMGTLVVSLSATGGVLNVGVVVVPTAGGGVMPGMASLPGLALVPGHHHGRHGLIGPRGALHGSERDHAGGEEHEEGKEASHQVRKMDMEGGGRHPLGVRGARPGGVERPTPEWPPPGGR